MWNGIISAFCVACLCAGLDQWCEGRRADIIDDFNERRISRYMADLKLERLEKIQEYLPMVGWIGVTVAAIGCVFVIIQG